MRASDPEGLQSPDGGGLTVAPSMGPALASVQAPPDVMPLDNRAIVVSLTAIAIGVASALIAVFLTMLIGLITNLAYYGRFSLAFVQPSIERLGVWSVFVPIAGAVIVGVMARYGSKAIRGHGIPEVMERVLHGESRIPPKVMFLKPLSAAVAIGTGGPFGAEGPIIATGGALGSFVGQVMRITADERKTLLAAGAAGGMAATFGSPVSAVLLAVELLLFEYRARSIIPVALAAAAATAVRVAIVGGAPVFAIPDVAQPGLAALASYTVLGAVIGALAVAVTRAVYAIEDGFEKLPIHWMWWPTLGAIVVGIVGLIDPRTLGVGYVNIDEILSGRLLGTALIVLVALKFVSWSIYLGSGTSGGTLAPLFTIGGGVGAALGAWAAAFVPATGMNVQVAALVGMAAIFAGASHALLASIVFAFETTRQPLGLLPLLAGCSAAYLVSLLLMRTSIMTEKLARRGTDVRPDYTLDYLGRVLVRDAASRDVVTLAADSTVAATRDWLADRTAASTHQGFPILGADGGLVGVLTRRDILDPTVPADRRLGELVRRPPVVIFEDNTLREAADQMVRERVGRLCVVPRESPRQIDGILTRSDLLGAHERRLDAEHAAERQVALRLGRWGREPAA